MSIYIYLPVYLYKGVENIEGQGGERHVTIFCPYWVINTSQYALRIRDDRENILPAGTVSSKKYVFI